MSRIGRRVALVVKKSSTSDACFLLIVNKKWTVGDFSSVVLPGVGSVITMESRQGPAGNTVTVSAWDNYTGYEPMGPFVGKDTGSASEFTGMFYTTGCVRYCEVPLENPAIFNNYIGIVIDKTKLLNENYIGKLKATVTFTKVDNAYCWILCRVDEYFKKDVSENPNDHGKRRGIVGAVNQGPQQSSHYITSRLFPYDVRWFSGPNVNAVDVAGLLGREVMFSARKSFATNTNAHYVEGDVTPAKSDLRTVVREPYFSVALNCASNFHKHVPSSAARLPVVIWNEKNNAVFTRKGSQLKIDIIVEFVGCTDEQQRTVVWSDRWEVVLDKYDIFKGVDYGLYRIEAIRHFAANDFPRWKVYKLIDVVKKFGKSGVQSTSSSHSSPPPITTSEISNHRYRSVSGSCSNSHGSDYEDMRNGLSRKMSEDLNISSSTIQKQNLNKHVRPCESEDELNMRSSRGPQRRFLDEDVEETLRIYMHRCLESSEVRTSIREADPIYFKCLVDRLMNV